MGLTYDTRIPQSDNYSKKTSEKHENLDIIEYFSF